MYPYDWDFYNYFFCIRMKKSVSVTYIHYDVTFNENDFGKTTGANQLECIQHNQHSNMLQIKFLFIPKTDMVFC